MFHSLYFSLYEIFYLAVEEGQLAQLLQRDRAAGWSSYGQKWKTGTGRQYFTDIIGLPIPIPMYKKTLLHNLSNWPAKLLSSVKKT